MDTAAPTRTEDRIHILLVVDQFPTELGGGERVALKIAQLLPRDRFRVSLMTFGGKLNVQTLHACGVETYIFTLRRTYGLQGFRTAAKIAAFARRERVDIVQTFFETSDLWAGPIVKFASGAKLVWSRRDLGILRGPKHRIAYRLLSRYVDAVIAVSDRVRQYTVETDRISPERIHTIYNGVTMPPAITSADRERIRKDLGLASSDVAVITVANIRRVKGFDSLLQAATRFHANVRFLIAGGVSERDYFENLKTQAQAGGITNSVIWLGARNDVANLLRASDIFVLPSRSEGFSNALLEGMAAGLPCIATDVGGNAEAIQDGMNGYIVAPDNPTTLADRIGRLVADQQLRTDIGARARQTVEHRFSDGQMIANSVKLYEELTTQVLNSCPKPHSLSSELGQRP